LFIGINQNPPELEKLAGAPLRNQKSDNPKILFPFVDLYKDAILKIMIDEEQLDLVDITHSCTEQQVGRCNRCWQCTERAWAFSKINVADTGLR
jgi:7-cyano-7-deazaguanine synthase in queuosine biosynthesis